MYPAIMFGVILLWHVLWRAYPKKRNYQAFWPTYRYIGGISVVFIKIVYLWTLGHALNLAGTSSMRFVATMVGILVLLFANVLPRLQPNWRGGIRTAWTYRVKKVGIAHTHSQEI